MQKLDINALKEVGAFAGEPVEREIEWELNGQKVKMTTFVRRLSYKMAVSDIKLSGDTGSMVAGRIASGICDENGQPVFSTEDITGDADPARGPLNYNLTLALLTAISEVNSLGKAPA